MVAFHRAAVISLALILAIGILVPAPVAKAAASGQFRAYWVDAFGDGLFSEAQIDQVVAATKVAHLNAIVAQIGRRGDCFCNKASMPRTQAAIASAPFDPLESLIARAHAEGIQVHAWIITTAMWNSSTAPLDPTHAFNTHGPTMTGRDNWLDVRYDGALRETSNSAANWSFDPGHPDAADYIARMYTSVAANYGIDGLNFDRVRYPDGNDLAAWPGVNQWGYNAVALARFQAATARTDRPLPNDAQWMQWRRDQITGIVRKVYLETFAIKPQLRISADTITYGDVSDQLGGWVASRPYRETLQDWRGWTEEGILDLNIPMNYKRDQCHATGPGCFGDQHTWYRDWSEFAKSHQYRRQTTIGSALYLNTISNSVAQIREALRPGAAGDPSFGWVGYSYRAPDDLASAGTRSGDAGRAELTKALTEPSSHDTVIPPVFASTVAVPEMTWKTHPTTGHLRGTAIADSGSLFDGLRVDLYDAETGASVATTRTDGSGWFGFVDLVPGRYKAIAALTGRHVAITSVAAGGLATVSLAPRAIGPIR